MVAKDTQFIKFDSFLRKFQMGKFVELDLTGMRNIVKQLRDAQGRFVSKNGLLHKAIFEGCKLAIHKVSWQIFRAYESRLKASPNPIVGLVLEVLSKVISEMQQNPTKYFNVKIQSDNSLLVRARPFNMEVFNTSTKGIRQRYWRRAGNIKGTDKKVPGLFMDNPLYGRNSKSIGMGVLFEFGRGSAGVIRPGQEPKSTLYLKKPSEKEKARGITSSVRKRKIKGTEAFAYYTVLDQDSNKKLKKKEKPSKRRALLIPVGKGGTEYVFRSQSRWGRSTGLHKIYSEKNVLRTEYVKTFIDTLTKTIQSMGFRNISVSKA